MVAQPNATGGEDQPREKSLTSGVDWDRYRSYLHLIARANLGTVIQKKVDASDVVQQTLMYAYEKQDDFRGDNESKKLAWLKQILRSKIIDFARHFNAARRDAKRELEIEKSVNESFARAEDWLAASQTSPSLHAEKQEQLLQLPNALELLPDELSDVIVMHHIQGMKLREIADEIGCNETTVGRRLMRGLKQLKEAMRE